MHPANPSKANCSCQMRQRLKRQQPHQVCGFLKHNLKSFLFCENQQNQDTSEMRSKLAMAQELPDFGQNFQKDALSNQNVERVRD